MPPKRAADGADDNAHNPAAAAAPDEFTRVVRKKLAASTRTSVACDRCKVRGGGGGGGAAA